MDIKTISYQLCKSVWKSKYREKVQNVIQDINTSDNEKRASGRDRSHFGYTARQLDAQIAGYLVLDRDRERIRDEVLPINLGNTLSEEERLLLSGAHAKITELDQRCIFPIIESFPGYLPAIDPYHRFHYSAPEEKHNLDLFDENISIQLVQEFHNHEAIQTFFKTVELAEKNLPKDQLIKASYGAEKSLTTSGVEKAPENLSQIAFGTHPNDPARITARFFLSLMCLRASIDVLNELVYQAILSNKLPLLNENNVISYKTMHNHLGGRGIRLLAQADENIGFLQPGLVLVKDKKLGMNIDLDLCKVEKVSFEMSNDYGDTFDVDLRQVNQNLNPYDNILTIV